ncbi:F-box domain-containing protein 9 [Elsinoe australis]|uniref:F-box domain-containing protein 9 n=1 Tax=Elsinoe australis TaxID=40998 RepID=A0A4U7AS27_9PEZI|nr:F-box domain-containing protein 9 [Elsinoe australis]
MDVSKHLREDAMDIDHESAIIRVLQVPELLELILSHLPKFDLLLSQRTCRLFHNIINTSPCLQKLLFMRPDWTLEGHYADDKPGTRPLNNLMLRQILGGMYPTMTLRMLSFTSPEAFTTARNRMHLSSTTDCPFPLLPEPNNLKPDPGPNAALGFWAWNVNVSFPANALLTAQQENPAIAYEHASWRKMYMSQPPATELHLCRRWQRAAQPAVVVETGITMEDLAGAAQDSKRAWNEVFISSDRDWHLEGPIRYSHFGLAKDGK